MHMGGGVVVYVQCQSVSRLPSSSTTTSIWMSTGSSCCGACFTCALNINQMMFCSSILHIDSGVMRTPLMDGCSCSYPLLLLTRVLVLTRVVVRLLLNNI